MFRRNFNGDFSALQFTRFLTDKMYGPAINCRTVLLTSFLKFEALHISRFVKSAVKILRYQTDKA